MKKYIATNTYFVCALAVSAILLIPYNARAYDKEIQNLSGVMAEKIAQAGKKTVAVTDFTDLQGNITELGRFIAERFSVALAGSGKGLSVIDRTHIKTLLREHKLSESGLIDTTTAKELGKIAGVEALITGTLTPFGDTVEMAVKVLDTETAKIIDASTGSVAKTEAIKELLERGISTNTPSQQTTTSKVMPVPVKGQPIIEKEGFSFVLQECKRSGPSVSCNFLITSIETDQKLGFNSGNSRIFDDLGNEYQGSSTRIGNKSDAILLIKDIPVKASVAFNQIDSQANFAALLEFYFYAKSSFVLQYRNVPFSN